MKRFLALALVASAAIFPAMAHAQWQVTYVSAKNDWKFYPVKSAPPPPYHWSETSYAYSINDNIASDSVIRGSGGMWNVNDITLYHEAQATALVDITVRWIGSPSSVPSSVRLKLNTHGWGECDGARDTFGTTITVNDGFGGSNTGWSSWGSAGPPASYGARADVYHTEDYGTIQTNGQTTVFNTEIYMNEQCFANLRQTTNPDPNGDVGFYVSSGWDMQMLINP